MFHSLFLYLIDYKNSKKFNRMQARDTFFQRKGINAQPTGIKLQPTGISRQRKGILSAQGTNELF
jgi:hypothetical protein